MSATPAGPALLINNRQRAVSLDVARIARRAEAAIAFCLRRRGVGLAVLDQLSEIEVAVVSDRVIAQVHRQFLGVPGATDVITFEHGELVVSATTAARQAQEHGETVERETLRYIVHGLLHLNGHEDSEAADAARMWRAQEAILQSIWPAGSTLRTVGL